MARTAFSNGLVGGGLTLRRREQSLSNHATGRVAIYVGDTGFEPVTSAV